MPDAKRRLEIAVVMDVGGLLRDNSDVGLNGLRATDRFLACMASCAHVSNDDCACHALSMLTTASLSAPLCLALRLPWCVGGVADDSGIRIHRLLCRHLT